MYLVILAKETLHIHLSVHERCDFGPLVKYSKGDVTFELART